MIETEQKLNKDEERTSPKDAQITSAADELDTTVNDDARLATPALKALIFEEKKTPVIDECKTSIENSVTKSQGNESGTAVEDEVGASLAMVREINGAQITVKIKSAESFDDNGMSTADNHEMVDFLPDHKEIDYVDEIDDFAEECDSVKSESDQLEDFDDERNETESDQLEDFDDERNETESDQLEDFDDERNESESDQMEDIADDANSIKSDGDQMEDDSFETTMGNMEEAVQSIKQVSVN